MLVAKISYMVIMHNLLSKTYFENQRELYIEIIIHHLLEKIYKAWNINKVISLFMIDIFIAYPNISY